VQVVADGSGLVGGVLSTQSGRDIVVSGVRPLAEQFEQRGVVGVDGVHQSSAVRTTDGLGVGERRYLFLERPLVGPDDVEPGGFDRRPNIRLVDNVAVGLSRTRDVQPPSDVRSIVEIDRTPESVRDPRQRTWRLDVPLARCSRLGVSGQRWEDESTNGSSGNRISSAVRSVDSETSKRVVVTEWVPVPS